MKEEALLKSDKSYYFVGCFLLYEYSFIETIHNARKEGIDVMINRQSKSLPSGLNVLMDDLEESFLYLWQHPLTRLQRVNHL
mgnify:CR=1 FL=1